MATYQVTADSDDCARRLTTSYWNLGGDYVIAGYNGATNKQWGCGMRFQNITIPQGSTITEAYLTVRCLNSYSGETVNSRISAEDVDDAATFADDSAAFDTRWANRTTARVDWDDIPAWTANTEYNSPSIITVIQEIVDRSGWASGNDIVIFWDDFDDRSGTDAFSYRDASSHEENSTDAPKLVIVHSGGGAGGGGTPLVTTQECTNTTARESTGHGLYSAEGDSSVTQHGHCWSTAANPTTADSKTENGASPNLGQFQSAITGLTPGTTYYVRAYAVNAIGTSYGDDVTITTGTTIERRHIWIEGKELHYFDQYGDERKIEGVPDTSGLPWWYYF